MKFDRVKKTEYASYLCATPLRLCLVDKVSGEGPIGDFEIWLGEMSINEEELEVWPVTAKPFAGSDPVEWYPE